MDSSGLVSLFRLEMDDLVDAYLWADAEILGYINDAQKMFCRKTDGISDASTPGVVDIKVTQGTDWVDMHPSILKIRALTRTDTGRPVEVINVEDMPGRGWFFDGRPGYVKALVTGAEAHRARVWPLSGEDVTLMLMVFRLPLTEIADFGQTLEIDEEHHRHLLLWCKHLAYSKQDSEAFDKTKAAEFEGRFAAYCEQVKAEERRKRHKTRVVRYGGI